MGAVACSTCDMKPPQEVSTMVEEKKIVKKKYLFTCEEMAEAFHKFDVDKNAAIDLNEFADVLEDMGVKFTSSSLKEVYNHLDEDGSGGVSLEEFQAFFDGKDKRKGLKGIMKNIIKMKKKEGRLKDEASRDNKKPVDVYIIHGSGEASNSRAWWLSNVLEFADLKCFGDYLNCPREGDTTAKAEAENPNKVQENWAITDAELVVLMLDRRSSDHEGVSELLQQIEDPERTPVVTLYETDRGAEMKVLKEWMKKCPEAFSTMPKPVSRHYVSDSEQIALQVVFSAMGKAVPLLTNVRPPGSDLDDFAAMQSQGIKFVQPEYMMVVQPGDTQVDFPAEAFEVPSHRRPIFVSYAQEDPSVPGLSTAQLVRLKDTLKKLRMGGRVFFLDCLSLRDGRLCGGLNVSDILTLSRYIILDEVENGIEPYFDRGSNFLELLLCLLTGNLAPRDRSQFVELDNRVGEEFQKGVNFRRYVRENKNKSDMVDGLCERLRSKSFKDDAESKRAEEIFREALSRNPVLQEEPDLKISAPAA